jgi:hypothetical protein
MARGLLSPLVMGNSIDYSNTLRAIGQVLEKFHAQAYDIVCYDNCYLVRYQTQERQRKVKSFPNFLRLWRDEVEPNAGGPNRRPPMNVELIYTSKDIERLDEQEKAGRRVAKGMPNPHSISNLLRGAGKTVDAKKNSRLLLASNHDHTVVVIYQTPNGARKVEEHPVSELYDAWVQTYLKRKEPLRVAS